jgi:hypothetical protein
MKRNPVALAVALLLFGGWVAYLGIQALRERRPVVVSRAQLALSQFDVDADLAPGPDGQLPLRVTVKNVRWAASPDKPTGEIAVANLRKTQGYSGPGTYRLPLVRNDGEYDVAGIPGAPADPGYARNDVPLPRIYPLAPAVERQWDEVRGLP